MFLFDDVPIVEFVRLPVCSQPMAPYALTYDLYDFLHVPEALMIHWMIFNGKTLDYSVTAVPAYQQGLPKRALEIGCG